jgi:hypothetical protein
MTNDKVFLIESEKGPYQMVLRNVMRMVPDRDKNDVALQRLIAFRLRIDGESTTREYLMRKIRDMIQSSYHGRLYDFLKQGQQTASPSRHDLPPPAPEIA